MATQKQRVDAGPGGQQLGQLSRPASRRAPKKLVPRTLGPLATAARTDRRVYHPEAAAGRRAPAVRPPAKPATHVAQRAAEAPLRVPQPAAQPRAGVAERAAERADRVAQPAAEPATRVAQPAAEPSDRVAQRAAQPRAMVAKRAAEPADPVGQSAAEVPAQVAQPAHDERRQLAGSREDISRIRFGEHAHPHRVLGPHPGTIGGRNGVVVRTYDPEAEQAWCLLGAGEALGMQRIDAGVFAAFVPGHTLPLRYRLMYRYPDGRIEQRGDPYRFGPTINALDLSLFEAGEHQRLWEVLGAHPRVVEGVAGTGFAVWAPSARRVSVLGDFCDWDGRRLPMRALGQSGVWELFVPEVGLGATYLFEIRTDQFALLRKTDPFAFKSVLPPAQGSQVTRSGYEWKDGPWMQQRRARDPAREPMVVYELHLGSWARAAAEAGRHLTYRELAPRLVEHARRFGFTHIELLPVAEHALYASWGYEVTGHYAPTARYGSPDDLRYLVDTCHQHGIGVILDWVPGHFPRDDAGLSRFDGTALFEPNPGAGAGLTEWGTERFDYSRPQVKNFLLANALYWAREFHVDGLRVDAVASMLGYPYRDETQTTGAGPGERAAAARFLRELNAALKEQAPGVMTFAEDSTPSSGMTQAVSAGGLGFTFKWNLGWMHDTLAHFSRSPEQRGEHTDELSFAMLYEHTERFVNALSHDEVVHGKRSLLEKMPGELDEQLANLRLLLTYQYTRPGKVLLFMGAELGQSAEWDHDRSLDWGLADDAKRTQLQSFLAELGRVYHQRPALWRSDSDPAGFEWLDCGEHDRPVLAYLRRDGSDHVLVVLNLGHEPWDDYRVGVPGPGRYHLRLSTDEARFGGAGGAGLAQPKADAEPAQGRAHSLRLRLPPLGAVVLVPA